MGKRNSNGRRGARGGRREAGGVKRPANSDRGGFKASRHGKASAAGPKAEQKLAAEEREKSGLKHAAHEAGRFLRGQRIDPRRINGKETVAELIEGTYLAYNAARLREACQLLTDKMLDADVTVGLSLTGALSPARLALSAPIDTSPQGESAIGMTIAAVALDGNKLGRDPNMDVSETASIVLDAKRGGGRSGVMILGGGSPKNFMLQTEPQIQEVLGIDEKGHDYFLQITDARPDTGGLSGATPAEAVSWGQIHPARLPDAVGGYLDSTVALPLLTSYAFARHKPRPLRRLFDRREAMMSRLRQEYEKSSAEPAEIDHTDSKLPQHR